MSSEKLMEFSKEELVLFLIGEQARVAELLKRNMELDDQLGVGAQEANELEAKVGELQEKVGELQEKVSAFEKARAQQESRRPA